MGNEFPKRANIETTNACNLKCPMCARTTAMTRDVEHMSFELFRHIADELGQHELERVWLHIFGEPLMHPQIFEFISYIKQYPKLSTVGLSTNVTVLTEDKSAALLDSSLDDILLAVDAATSDAYARTRGANFDHVERNVTTFLEMHRRRGSSMKVDIQLIPMLMNVEDIDAFRTKWDPYVGGPVSLALKPFTDFAGQVPDVGLRGVDAAQYAPVQFIARGKRATVPCASLWEDVNIHSHGGVVACCLDVNGQMHLGDVTRNSIAEVWNDEPLRLLRDAHTRSDLRDYALCDGCFMTCGVDIAGSDDVTSTSASAEMLPPPYAPQRWPRLRRAKTLLKSFAEGRRPTQ